MTTTHVLMCVDMSGSMDLLAEDVRGGFNAYLDALAADPEDHEYRLTVTLFDTEFIPLAVDKPLAEVPRLTAANYAPRGLTALFDAVGKTLTEFQATHGKVGKNERALMVIQTDGHENSSREFRHRDQVRKLIKDREATGRWGFIFMGAGVDAWAQGDAMGLGATTVAIHQSGVGTRSAYSGLGTASAAFASGASIGETYTIVSSEPGVADQDAPKPEK